MSGHVDVIAVLDQAIQREEDAGQASISQIAARAAVVELIEVVRAIVAADDAALQELSAFGINLVGEEPAFLLTERARAALSRLGGAA